MNYSSSFRITPTPLVVYELLHAEFCVQSPWQNVCFDCLTRARVRRFEYSYATVQNTFENIRHLYEPILVSKYFPKLMIFRKLRRSLTNLLLGVLKFPLIQTGKR